MENSITVREGEILRMEPAGVKVIEALQGMVGRIIRSWEEENPKRAIERMVRNGAFFEGFVTWMNEQKQRIKVAKEAERQKKDEERARLAILHRQQPDVEKVTLHDDNVNVAIITTASLPWMTGTAVNPLLRAAYLSKLQKQVTLLVPWLSPKDQKEIHPGGRVFETPAEQEEWVRRWLKNRVGFESNFKLTFYPGKYQPEKGSIFAVGDITEYVPDSEAQIAVLEEPEHLNWYHVGRRWCDKFKHVVGIVHTNYLEYVRREENGELKENVLRAINDWVVRGAGVHTVVKLSDAVQDFKKGDSVTCFVHGVSPKFLEVGRMVGDRLKVLNNDLSRVIMIANDNGASNSNNTQANMPANSTEDDAFDGFDKGCYFLGKVLWGKGYSELLSLMQDYSNRNGTGVDVDVFGGGPDLNEVVDEAEKRHLSLHFHGARDHGDMDFHRYKVFINPSMSDVVATTTAEALAMGKFVICADHPSNSFFRQFTNCLTYRNPDEFTNCLNKALREQPAPLRPDELRDLSWEAATERFLNVAEPRMTSAENREIPKMLDAITANAFWTFHQGVQHLDWGRQVIGAAPGTNMSLSDLSDVKRLDALPRRPVFPTPFNNQEKVVSNFGRQPVVNNSQNSSYKKVKESRGSSASRSSAPGTAKVCAVDSMSEPTSVVRNRNLGLSMDDLPRSAVLLR